MLLLQLLVDTREASLGTGKLLQKPRLSVAHGLGLTPILRVTHNSIQLAFRTLAF